MDATTNRAAINSTRSSMYRILGVTLLTGFLYAMWYARHRDTDFTRAPHPDSGGFVVGIVCVFFGLVILMLEWR